ncbi:MAG: GWxTD domain-containing protein, partial [Thermoanaerobaculia bacterium]
MKLTRVFATAFVLSALAAGAFAALSDANTQFGKGPAQYLMSREEIAAWKNVKDDAEAQAFINMFWARRDPTPTTPENEFRIEFEQRVKYADEHFTEGRTKGSMTDRGRVFLVMGSPAVVRRSAKPTTALGVPEPSTGIGAPQPAQESAEKNMIWVYDQAKTKVALPAPTVNVAFVDQFGNEVWRLDRSPGVDVNAMLQRAAAAAVTNPNATGAPMAKTSMPQPAPVAVATPVATTGAAMPTTLKSAAYQSAIADETAGKSTLKKGSTIAYTELLSPTGDYYVPLGIFVPKSVGLAADAVDTMFGVVKDSSGNTVAVFEEPAKATPSNGDLLADRTVILPSGKYTAVFGLAKGDQPVVVASGPLDLNTVTKDAGGTSKLILTNNIIETATPAPPKTAFAFGKLKIV